MFKFFEGIRDYIFTTGLGETTMKATITPTTDGFALRSGGQTLGTYTRRRDAVRGAARRELHVIG